MYAKAHFIGIIKIYVFQLCYLTYRVILHFDAKHYLIKPTNIVNR